MSQRLKEIEALMDEHPDMAHDLLMKLSAEFPNDDKALYLLGVLNSRADRFPLALAIFERLTRLAPQRKQVWNAYGQVLAETYQTAQAREAFRRAYAISKEALFLSNIGSTYLTEANSTESIRWCKKALEMDPKHSGALANLGFAQLAQGDWSGWKNVEESLGGKFRKKQSFNGEPQWDGSFVDDLIVYGEQGLGDEIMYASCLEDVSKRVGHVTIECDKRLGGLFTRSFPWAEVHNTRRESREWSEDRKFGAALACGSMPSFVRPTLDSCPRTPYLVADPERRIQWRALFDSFKRPVIGLAWASGNFRTGKSKRTIGLGAFKDLVLGTDAEFVSLQYIDPTEEIEDSGLPVRHYPRATLTQDYDDTAGMVAELDLIIGVHTTVHHLAGALGVPSIVLVPSQPLWIYQHGDRMPWYGQQVYHRQKKDEAWQDCINRIERPFKLREAA